MPDTRPNIILIITDQQRYDTIAALGFPYMDTPHLDRLVREGIAFSNCFRHGRLVRAGAGQPVHRLLSPHHGGAQERRRLAALLGRGPGRSRLPLRQHRQDAHLALRDAPGLSRALCGGEQGPLPGRPLLFRRVGQGPCRRTGWSSSSASYTGNGPTTGERLGAFEWKLPEHTHSDFFVGDLATWWFATTRRRNLCSCRSAFPALTRPMIPFPAMPSRTCKRTCRCRNCRPGELEGQPAAQKELREHNTRIDHDSIVWLHEPTREQLHRQRAYYLANVTMIDEKVGQILQALEQQGYLENAVVIFTSDHGDCLGDHGHIEKWTMYDIITRVPCIVWAPGRFAGGRQPDALVQQIDLAPLIMELAGLPVPPSWEGISIAPLLQGDGMATHREYVFAEQPRDATLTHTEMETMVRSADWKLVHYLGNQDGELYDLRNDPGEHSNLWGNPAYREHQERLQNVLWIGSCAARSRLPRGARRGAEAASAEAVQEREWTLCLIPPS